MNIRHYVIAAFTFLLLAAGAKAGERHAPFLLLVPDHSMGFPGIEQSATTPAALDRILGAAIPLWTKQGADGRAQSFLAIDAGHGLSLLCDSSFGLSRALGDISQQCLLGRIEGNDLIGIGAVSLGHSIRLGGESFPFDLSFGLSWLHSSAGLSAGGPSHELDLFSERFAPSEGLVEELSGESLQISATHWLNERSWMRVSGQSARFRADRNLGLPALNWTNSALRLDAGYGSFAGSVVGHQTESPLTRRSWFDIDLGVSWRTPWAGRVTVGARNLLSPSEGNPLGVSPGDTSTNSKLMEARTPYVRYQQDL